MLLRTIAVLLDFKFKWLLHLLGYIHDSMCIPKLFTDFYMRQTI